MGVCIVSEEQNQEEFKNPISMGPMLHPITGEAGIRLQVGNSDTWLSFQEAQNIVTNMQTITIVGITTSVLGQMIAQSQQPIDPQLILPQ